MPGRTPLPYQEANGPEKSSFSKPRSYPRCTSCHGHFRDTSPWHLWRNLSETLPDTMADKMSGDFCGEPPRHHRACHGQRASCSSLGRSAGTLAPGSLQRPKRKPAERSITASRMTRATSARATRKVPGDGKSPLCDTPRPCMPASPLERPHGLTMVEPSPEPIRKASAFSFQKRTEPPLKGAGLGSVVPIDEQRTTRSEGSARAFCCASAATWCSTPSNSTARISFCEAPPPTAAAIATVSMPVDAAARVSGLVTSPTNTPSLSSHALQPSSSRAFVTFRTSARTSAMRLSALNWR
mmetsp:Transcript_16066/g.50774  ORF Transcript_16066/g.50774 Transcript_16066/m.50774 type:complete len:297 (+) Transcript_16066:16-906(+)